MDYNLLRAPGGETPAQHTSKTGTALLAPLEQEYLPASAST